MKDNELINEETIPAFDYEKAIDFLNNTNQKNFNVVKGLKNKKFLLSKDIKNLKPANLLCAGYKTYYVYYGATTLETVYLRGLYQNNYSLDFTFDELCDVVDAFFEKYNNEHLDKESINMSLKEQKKHNINAIDFLKDLL